MALELNQTCYKNAGVCQTLHKITQPKLDSGLYLRKNISFRPSSFSLFNKGHWNKNKRKQKQQRTGSPFSIKGATHLMILIMHINNHAKHIRTRQTNLPTSSRFPLVSWPCDPWCYTNRDRSGSACNFSGSCHVVSAKSYQVHRVIFGKCAMPVCSRGALQQLTVLAQNRENHGKNIWCFPKFSPTFSSFFSRCLRFPCFSSPFPQLFTLSFIDVLPLFPHEIHHSRRGEAVVKLPQLRDGITAAFQATRQDLVNAACSERIRKARNLWCGTFWIIGHDWSLKVWKDSIQVVWYESTFWIDMTSLEHIIFNSKFGPAKRKNEKCKRKNTTTTRITHAKYLEKKETNIRFLSENSWNITAKKNRQIFL